jgi:hypothetical protein
LYELKDMMNKVLLNNMAFVLIDLLECSHNILDIDLNLEEE